MSKIDSEQIEIIKKTFPKKYLHAKPRDDFTAQQWAATFGESSNCKKKKKKLHSPNVKSDRSYTNR